MHTESEKSRIASFLGSNRNGSSPCSIRECSTSHGFTGWHEQDFYPAIT